MTSPLVRAKQIFATALEVAERERPAFLDEACEGDQNLREQVDRLLTAFARADGFLAGGTDPGAAPSDELGSEQPGDRIDRYKLLQQIGEGGMGTVWMAEQLEPVRRKVALKVIKLGMDTKAVVARFEAERQALALMDHPSIAKVLDGGSTDKGRPYFVMELVKGVPITEFCDEAGLDAEERLRLMQQVCLAVQHAHQKGVIHRDLKPGNVMVTLHDGVPVPKVIDFGIAKATSAELTQKTLFTEFQQMIGTPEYMAPEQAELSGLDIDTRADVYSLGVLLYELLTGTKPFDLKDVLEQGYAEMLRVIREEDPPKPSTRISTLGKQLDVIAKGRNVSPQRMPKFVNGELDWIVMCALEKNRNRRYATASDFAADIERLLRHEPVQAAPPTASYRLLKYIRRNRVAVTTAGLVAVAMTVGLAMAIWGFVEADEQRKLAQQSERVAIDQRERADAAREQSDNLRVQALASARRATATSTVLSDMLLSITPKRAKGADTKLLEQLLEDVGKRLFAGEVEDDAVASELHFLLGKTYLRLVMFASAQRHLDAVIEKSGKQNAFAINSRLQLASMFQQIGTPEASMQGLEHCREVVKLDPAAFATARESIIDAYRFMSGLLRRQRKYAEAVKMLEHGLALFKSAPTPLRRMTQRNMQDSLGKAAAENGDVGKSVEIFEKLLRETVPGDQMTELDVKHNLAMACAFHGQVERAEELLAEVAAEHASIRGPDHLQTLQARHMLARQQDKRGKVAEAAATLLEIYGLGVARYGHDVSMISGILEALVSLREGQGDYDAMLALVETHLQGLEKAGAGDAKRMRWQVWRCITLRRLGRVEDARNYAKSILERLEPIENAAVDPDALGYVLVELAEMEYETERLVGNNQKGYHEAKRLLKRALNFTASRIRPGSDSRLAALTLLPLVCRSLGQHEEALQAARSHVESWLIRTGPDAPEMIRPRADVAKALEYVNRGEEAVAIYESLLEQYEPRFPGHFELREVRFRLGQILGRLARFSDALAQLDRKIQTEEALMASGRGALVFREKYLEARVYAVMALIGLERRDEALVRLEKLLTEAGHELLPGIRAQAEAMRAELKNSKD